MHKCTTYKYWVRLKTAGYSLIDSLVSMLIISIVFSVLISSIVALNNAQSALNKCMFVIEAEKEWLQKQKPMVLKGKSIQQIDSEGFIEIVKFEGNQKKMKWEVWQVQRE